MRKGAIRARNRTARVGACPVRARAELDLDGRTAAMAGKAWNDDAQSLIDEDPRVHTLIQVLNYKGV